MKCLGCGRPLLAGDGVTDDTEAMQRIVDGDYCSACVEFVGNHPRLGKIVRPREAKPRTKSLIDT